MNKIRTEYQLIDGKPHLGHYFGCHNTVISDAFCGDLDKNPITIEVKKSLRFTAERKLPTDCEIRNDSFILRPPYFSGPIDSYGSIAYKFMIWGRAFKIKKLLKKAIPRYQKKLVNGKRKLVRVDK